MSHILKSVAICALLTGVGFVFGTIVSYWWNRPWLQIKESYNDLDNYRIEKINIEHASLADVIGEVQRQIRSQGRSVQFYFGPVELKRRRTDRFLQTNHTAAGFLDGVCQVFDVKWAFVDDGTILIYTSSP